MKSQNKKAFTLVELIIVITILAILATIGFMSYSSYTSDARDANRTTSLQEIGKGLDIYSIKSSKLPSPENPVNITASGITIGYQGALGDTLSSVIKMSPIPSDPLDNTKYIYSTNDTKTKYQLLAYLENQTSYNPNITKEAYAIDYTNRKFKTFGDKLGIILNSDNSPISGNVETQTGTTNYNIVFSDTNSYTLSGNLLSVIQAFRGDKSLASLDNSLLGYWDMDKLIQNGNELLLEDFSNNIVLSGSKVINNTNSTSIIQDGVKGKSLYLNGENRYLELGKLNKTISDFTTSLFIKTNNTYNSGVILTNNSYGSWTNGFKVFPAGSYVIRNDGEYVADGLNFSPISDNIWRNLTVNRGNGKLKIYIDGVNLYSTGITHPGQINLATTILSVGARDINDGAGFFKGNIDELKIYNQALSDNAVKAIYDATK